MDLLWPSCRSVMPTLDLAKMAFAMHVLHDNAWLVLGEEEICRVIDGLE